MSIEDKIKNAQSSSWLTDGIPKWKVRFIIWWAKVKAKLRKKVTGNDERRSNNLQDIS